MKTHFIFYTLSRKLTLAFTLLVFICYQSQAQTPDWEVNENDFEFTMTFVSFLTIDGDRLQNENDLIGAFVGNENRGVTNLTYVENEDAYYAFLTVHANEGGEPITFRIYDSVNNEIREVQTTLDFEINAHFGNLFQAYSFADPILSSEANIIDLSFQNTPIIETIIGDGEITITVDQSEDTTGMTPVFTLSNGASLFENGTEYSSGEESFDFLTPVVFQVRSADQTVLRPWTVTVNQIDSDIIYRKKDAVCYEPGAIRVNITTANNDILLFQEGILQETLTVIDGEVTFENLDAGVYEVHIGTITKEITINLRTE